MRKAPDKHLAALIVSFTLLDAGGSLCPDLRGGRWRRSVPNGSLRRQLRRLLQVD